MRLIWISVCLSSHVRPYNTSPLFFESFIPHSLGFHHGLLSFHSLDARPNVVIRPAKAKGVQYLEMIERSSKQLFHELDMSIKARISQDDLIFKEEPYFSNCIREGNTWVAILLDIMIPITFIQFELGIAYNDVPLQRPYFERLGFRTENPQPTALPPHKVLLAKGLPTPVPLI